MPRRRDGGAERQDRLPFIHKVFADIVYVGEEVANATSIVVDIVRKLADQVVLQVLTRRWVGRTLLRLYQPQPTDRPRLRGHHRFGDGFSLRRLRHAADPPATSFGLRFRAGRLAEPRNTTGWETPIGQARVVMAIHVKQRGRNNFLFHRSRRGLTRWSPMPSVWHQTRYSVTL